MSICLVTGGAGFIGSHIAQSLLHKGNQVRILDNFSTGKLENLTGFTNDVEIIRGDIRDVQTVNKALAGVEVVFHQAAFVSNPKSILEPEACYSINIHGTEILLEESRKAGVRCMVIASSAAVYGDSTNLPLGEDEPLKPLTPYAASKVACETLAGMYSRSMGLEVVSLRYFNVYGPRQSPQSEYAAAIPIFINRMRSNEIIFIEGDGKQTRDLIFVEDVASANLQAMEKPGVAGQIINICTGQESSVLQVVDTLYNLFPASPPPLYKEKRPGDIYRSVGKPDLSMKFLGFKAQTSLQDGIDKTVQWFNQ